MSITAFRCLSWRSEYRVTSNPFLQMTRWTGDTETEHTPPEHGDWRERGDRTLRWNPGGKSNRYATSNAGLSQRVHFVDTRPDNDGDWGVCLCTWLVMGNWMRDRCGCSELRWEWSLWLGGGGAWTIRYTRWRSPIGAAQHSNTWLVFAVPVPVCYRNPPSSPAPPI